MELTQRGCAVAALGTHDSDYEADRHQWKCAGTAAFRPLGPARLAYAPAMGAALQQGNPDLVHLHGIWMAVSAINHSWYQRTRRPYVVSSHGMLDRWALHHQHWKKRLAGWIYENRNLRDAACLHALSQQEVQDYRSYGLTNPIALIPNGVDLPGSKGSLPPPWQDTVPDGARVMLFLGRLHAKKGLLELVEGWHRSEAPRRGWVLMIAGWDDGGHEAQVAQRITQLSLADSVRLIGPQHGEGKAACLGAAEAFVLPSHSEGLPVAVLEAWSYSLPALLTPACNLPEGYAQGAALRISTSPEAIAEGLNLLTQMSAGERARMGQRGRQLVENSFTWPTITEQMIATYQWVLGRGRRPACIVE